MPKFEVNITRTITDRYIVTANGIPNRVDRIKGLGNAVVPQLIQAIGELVLAADKEIYR